MVHLRLNDPDTSRNKNINYVTALPQYADCEQARHRLLQLAAQVHPVMKAHGFQINSLEEFEWNREFAGRNWNNGETVELVLRRQDGSFAPLQWVLMVFCHELAHIKYMNHIPSQHGKLDRELRNECRNLQARGYYGDGFWSAGQRLQDNAFVAGSGMSTLQGLPEYSCGGAFQSRPSKGQARKPRRKAATSGSHKRRFRGPSLHTGAQTAPTLKSVRRVQTPLPGQGSRVDGHNHLPKATASTSSYKQDANSTFRKRTQTATARELRAQAAMRRINTLETKETAIKASDDPASFWPESGGDRKFKSEDSALSRHGRDEVTWKGEAELESDTEEEDSDEDGGLVIRLDSSSADESESGSALSKKEAGQNSGGRMEENPHEHSTVATGESQKQRMERSQLYRQHERKQGGTIRSTDDDWREFCSIAGLPTASSTTEHPVPALRTGERERKPQQRPIEVLSSDEEDIRAGFELPSTQSIRAPTHLSPEQEWPCRVCTLLNPSTASRCDACLTTKGSLTAGQ